MVLGNEKELWCDFTPGTSKPRLFPNQLQAALLLLWLHIYVTHGQCYYESAVMSERGHWDSRPQAQICVLFFFLTF